MGSIMNGGTEDRFHAFYLELNIFHVYAVKSPTSATGFDIKARLNNGTIIKLRTVQRVPDYVQLHKEQVNRAAKKDSAASFFMMSKPKDQSYQRGHIRNFKVYKENLNEK